MFLLSVVLLTGNGMAQKTLGGSDPDAASPNSKTDHKDNPGARQAWFMRGRTVKGENSALLLRRAYRQRERMRQRLQQQMLQQSGNSTQAGSGVLPAGAQFTATGGAWTNLGPAPITGMGNIGDASGRIVAVTVDQCDTTGNTVLMGAAYGGVWRSTNAATATPSSVTWASLYDYDPAATTLSVGAVSLQPGNCSGSTSSVILVGTGEPNWAIDSYYGHGILRSTDGGTTWALISSADSGANPFDGMGVAQFAWSTSNTSLVVAAFSNGSSVSLGLNPGGNQGMYYSTDAGATWHKGNNATDSSFGSPSAVVWNATLGKFFAAFKAQGIYSSSDGISWTRTTAQPVSFAASCSSTLSCDMLRASLTVTPGSADMYAWVVGSNGTTNKGISKTTNGGGAWTSFSVSGITTCGDTAGCGTGQGFYDLYLMAVPTSTGTDLYAGAVNLYKCSIPTGTTSNFCGAASTGSSNLANTWMNLTHVYGSCGTSYLSIHPDNHQGDFLRGGTNANKYAYFGNDGGAYRTLNSPGVNTGVCSSGTGNPFDDLNTSTLGSISQFIYISQDPTVSTTLLGGTQDNGSPGTAQDQTNPVLTPPLWYEAWGGDGGFNQIDQTNPLNWYTANTDVSIQQCTHGTGCLESFPFSQIVGSAQVGGDHGAFYVPFILDPANQATIIVGTCRVWSGPTTGASLTVLSKNFDTNTATACTGGENNLVSTLAAGGTPVSGASPVIYAGTAAGHVFVTTNANAGTSSTWTDVTGTINPGGFPISYVTIDPTDATGQTAYVTIMGFSGDPQGHWHLFKTTNAGTGWTDVGVGLPDAPADAVAVDPNDHNTLYVATDVGVFVTYNGGGAWQEYGTELPNVAAVALKIFNSGGTQKIRVGTHGRGVWENALAPFGPPTTVSVTPSSGTGTTQTFAAQYSDARGFGNITRAYLEINGSNSLVGACAAYYDSASNSVFLNQDNGSGWTGPSTIGQAGTLQNSQCTLNAGTSSVNGASNTLTVNFAITFKTPFVGTKNVYLNATNLQSLSAGWHLLGTWNTGTAVAPTAVSVTPNSGTGTTQTFAFQFSDANGNADISSVYMNINGVNTYPGACAANFNSTTNNLYIINDAGSSWGSPIAIGSAGTLQNSQCSINVGTSSVSKVGNNVTVNLAITFKAPFVGNKNIYMRAFDREGLSSSWLTAGTWNPNTSVAPSAVSVTPNSGTGTTQTFAFLFSDGNGAADISSVYMNINGVNTYPGACAANFNSTTNNLYIINDAGSSWGSPIVIGTAGTLQNSQCSINVGTSSVSKVGNNVTVNLAITFKSAFVGNKSVFMRAFDREGLSSSWLTAGTWNPNTSVAPSAVSVTPNSGTGTTQTFAFLFSDGNGATDISSVYINMNGVNTYPSACAANFNNTTNNLYIINDAGSSWGSPIVIGTAGTLQNSQCSIDTGASSVTKVGNNLTVNLAITFKAPFVGNKSVFMRAFDREGLSSSWLTAGTWNPNTGVAPTATSVTPSSGSGSTQSFAFLFADGNGAVDIAGAYMNFNVSNTYVGACALNYNGTSNGLYIINDAGSSWGSPITVGTAGTLQNSQCSVDTGASSVTKVGNNLTVTVAVTFKPAFTGGKNVFMKAVDKEGMASSWLTAGTWTVP